MSFAVPPSETERGLYKVPYGTDGIFYLGFQSTLGRGMAAATTW